MKVISSSPYAPFNSKEWNSLICKNAKFENTPIKIQKNFFYLLEFFVLSKQKIKKNLEQLKQI